MKSILERLYKLLRVSRRSPDSALGEPTAPTRTSGEGPGAPTAWADRFAEMRRALATAMSLG